MRQHRSFLQLVKQVIRKKGKPEKKEVKKVVSLSVSTPVLVSEDSFQNKGVFKEKYHSQRGRLADSEGEGKISFRRRNARTRFTWSGQRLVRQRKHHSCPDLMGEVGMLDYLDMDTLQMFQDIEESEEHLELIEVYLE